MKKKEITKFFRTIRANRIRQTTCGTVPSKSSSEHWTTWWLCRRRVRFACPTCIAISTKRSTKKSRRTQTLRRSTFRNSCTSTDSEKHSRSISPRKEERSDHEPDILENESTTPDTAGRKSLYYFFVRLKRSGTRHSTFYTHRSKTLDSLSTGYFP